MRAQKNTSASVFACLKTSRSRKCVQTSTWPVIVKGWSWVELHSWLIYAFISVRLETMFSLAPTSSNCTHHWTGSEPTTGEIKVAWMLSWPASGCMNRSENASSRSAWPLLPTFTLQADPEFLCWHGEHVSTVYRAERGESPTCDLNKCI